VKTVMNIDSAPRTVGDEGVSLAPQERAEVTLTDRDLDAVTERKLLLVDELDLSQIGEHTVAAVLDWVGDDTERRQAALAAEQAREDGARSTLVEKLTTQEG
jgi:hypothetical protein